MAEFFTVMEKVLEAFRIPLTVYGYQFSLFDVFIVGLLIDVVVMFIRRAFYE